MYGYVGAVALIVIGGLGIALSLGWVGFGRSRRPAPQFAYPERETNMAIVVRTSDERALRDVLAEFGASYGARDLATAGVALAREGDRIVVRFPRGLRGNHFLFLVNFLHYPFNGRGFADAYGVAEVEPLQGRVVVFVPSDDEEHTAVWMRDASDQTFHFSFEANAALEPVDPRGPSYREYWLP